jgi:hypothetical protein
VKKKKMKTKNKKAISTIIAVTVAVSILVAFSATASATTVCLAGTCDYTTIQDAIDAASDGDIIYVAAGTYNEQITINGVDVSLIADEGAIIKPTSCGIYTPKDVIEIYNSVATVEGFTIDADYSNSGCLGGIYARGGCGSTEYFDVDITAKGNAVSNYGKNGITANCELATVIIEGNTVTGRGVLPDGDHAQNGIQLGWEASGIIRGNTVSDHYWDGCSQPGKTGCTPWVATGILLYEVEGNLGQNALIKAENTFENNQFDVLRVLIPGPPEGNDEAPIQGRAPCDSIEQGIELPPYCGCLNEEPEPYAFQIGQEIGQIGGTGAPGNPNNAQAEELNLPENAVEVSPGVFYLGESQDINGKPVKGYAYIHYAKGYEPEVLETEDSTDDTSTCYGFIFGPDVKWETAEKYSINPTNNRGLDPTGILPTFEASVSTWENEITPDVIGDGTITYEKINWRKLDGINMVRFGNLPRDAIAMNIIWTDGTYLVEWDQIYDDKDFDWSLDCTAEDCESKMDFQNIATHELGHAFGLGDLYSDLCTEQTMYGYSDFGETNKRSLEDGDISGIQVLYLE